MTDPRQRVCTETTAERTAHMRAIVCTLLVAAVATAAAASAPERDGRPGCGIRYEFTRLWRNNYNNTVYWKCELWRQPAHSVACASATLFQESWQACVPFHLWYETPHSDPPTSPESDFAKECEALDLECDCPTEPPPVTTSAPWTTTHPTTDDPATTVSLIASIRLQYFKAKRGKENKSVGLNRPTRYFGEFKVAASQ